MKEFPDVPTWKEQGVDVVLQHLRGEMGPPKMKDGQLDFWGPVPLKMSAKTARINENLNMNKANFMS
ncbi:hypothetical protein DRW41_00870 [Neobacillus piezotolerans]|uniref:Uncharacterized protein n=1 Tax=Neobacillus piezotolerans TaxID=2259171 RepID=A0A3D8GUK6_9BACI|nr:hypothetical protein DRW41_00870 [Neobacillus piezotolerans]